MRFHVVLLVLCLLPFVQGFINSVGLLSPLQNAAIRRSSSSLRSGPAMTLDQMEADRQVVRKVALEKEGELMDVLEAVKRLEKASKQNKDEAENAKILSKLTGKWRLICTTGDKSGRALTGGKLSYFPIKAVQEFRCDTNPTFIANGVYLGPLSLVFSGELQLFPKMRRLEFFFNKVALGPIGIPVDMGRDAKVKPSFSWIDVTDEYALARGAGGGFGLWKRVDEI